MTDDKNKWSYLAGIFDGEGNFTLSAYYRSDERNGRLRYSFQVGVKNTDLRLMRWLIQNFGGVYYSHQDKKHPEWKESHIWRPKGRRNTENLILGILPYLIVKSEQAKLALEWIRLDGENNPEKRVEMVKEMQRLNQRGTSVETNTLSSRRVGLEPTDDEMIEPSLTGDSECAPAVTLVA